MWTLAKLVATVGSATESGLLFAGIKARVGGILLLSHVVPAARGELFCELQSII